MLDKRFDESENEWSSNEENKNKSTFFGEELSGSSDDFLFKEKNVNSTEFVPTTQSKIDFLDDSDELTKEIYNQNSNKSQNNIYCEDLNNSQNNQFDNEELLIQSNIENFNTNNKECFEEGWNEEIEFEQNIENDLIEANNNFNEENLVNNSFKEETYEKNTLIEENYVESSFTDKNNFIEKTLIEENNIENKNSIFEEDSDDLFSSESELKSNNSEGWNEEVQINKCTEQIIYNKEQVNEYDKQNKEFLGNTNECINNIDESINIADKKFSVQTNNEDKLLNNDLFDKQFLDVTNDGNYVEKCLLNCEENFIKNDINKNYFTEKEEEIFNNFSEKVHVELPSEDLLLNEFLGFKNNQIEYFSINYTNEQLLSLISNSLSLKDLCEKLFNNIKNESFKNQVLELINNLDNKNVKNNKDILSEEINLNNLTVENNNFIPNEQNNVLDENSEENYLKSISSSEAVDGSIDEENELNEQNNIVKSIEKISICEEYKLNDDINVNKNIEITNDETKNILEKEEKIDLFNDDIFESSSCKNNSEEVENKDSDKEDNILVEERIEDSDKNNESIDFTEEENISKDDNIILENKEFKENIVKELNKTPNLDKNEQFYKQGFSSSNESMNYSVSDLSKLSISEKKESESLFEIKEDENIAEKKENENIIEKKEDSNIIEKKEKESLFENKEDKNLFENKEDENMFKKKFNKSTPSFNIENNNSDKKSEIKDSSYKKTYSKSFADIFDLDQGQKIENDINYLEDDDTKVNIFEEEKKSVFGSIFGMFRKKPVEEPAKLKIYKKQEIKKPNKEKVVEQGNYAGQKSTPVLIPGCKRKIPPTIQKESFVKKQSSNTSIPKSPINKKEESK